MPGEPVLNGHALDIRRDQMPLFPGEEDASVIMEATAPAPEEPKGSLSIRAEILIALAKLVERGHRPVLDRIVRVEEGEFGALLLVSTESSWIAVQVTEQPRPPCVYQLPSSALRGLGTHANVTLTVDPWGIRLEVREKGSDVIDMRLKPTDLRQESWRHALEGWALPETECDADFDPAALADIERVARHCRVAALRSATVVREGQALRVLMAEDRTFVATVKPRGPARTLGARMAWPAWCN